MRRYFCAISSQDCAWRPSAHQLLCMLFSLYCDLDSHVLRSLLPPPSAHLPLRCSSTRFPLPLCSLGCSLDCSLFPPLLLRCPLFLRSLAVPLVSVPLRFAFARTLPAKSVSARSPRVTIVPPTPS